MQGREKWSKLNRTEARAAAFLIGSSWALTALCKEKLLTWHRRFLNRMHVPVQPLHSLLSVLGLGVHGCASTGQRESQKCPGTWLWNCHLEAQRGTDCHPQCPRFRHTFPLLLLCVVCITSYSTLQALSPILSGY